MDPELYVFTNIDHPGLKAAASSVVFAAAVALIRLLPVPTAWNVPGGPPEWPALLAGYAVFLYASLQAWIATREKNAAEDPRRGIATRLLETGAYRRARHPMYGMFILANAGLGLAAGLVYGLAFSLLSLLVYNLNAAIEEHAGLIPQFGDAYRAYRRRVPARLFTTGQALLLAATLALTAVGLVQ